MFLKLMIYLFKVNVYISVRYRTHCLINKVTEILNKKRNNYKQKWNTKQGDSPRQAFSMCNDSKFNVQW